VLQNDSVFDMRYVADAEAFYGDQIKPDVDIYGDIHDEGLTYDENMFSDLSLFLTLQCASKS
jgi:hypothetical protein